MQLYELGYYQMPMYMQEMILAGLQRKENEKILVWDKSPDPLPSVKKTTDDKRYSTLSRGLYEEVKEKKQFEQYGKFVLDTEKKKLVKIENESNFQFLIDPVVFAWSVDPLAHKMPGWSPYAAFANNPIFFIDKDGREVFAFDSHSKDLVLKTMNYAFGEKHGFEFVGNKLIHNNAVPSGISKEQEILFNYMINTIIDCNTITEVRANKSNYFETANDGISYSGIASEGSGLTGNIPSQKPLYLKNGAMIKGSMPSKNIILITEELINNGIMLSTEDGVYNKFSKEHATLHEFAHAIMNTIFREYDGLFNGMDFNKMSNEEKSDWAIRFTNTLLLSQNKKLEDGKNQHGRDATTPANTEHITPPIQN